MLDTAGGKVWPGLVHPEPVGAHGALADERDKVYIKLSLRTLFKRGEAARGEGVKKSAASVIVPPTRTMRSSLMSTSPTQGFAPLLSYMVPFLNKVFILHIPRSYFPPSRQVQGEYTIKQKAGKNKTERAQAKACALSGCRQSPFLVIANQCRSTGVAIRIPRKLHNI